jgi:hypothetical protein
MLLSAEMIDASVLIAEMFVLMACYFSTGDAKKNNIMALESIKCHLLAAQQQKEIPPAPKPVISNARTIGTIIITCEQVEHEQRAVCVFHSAALFALLINKHRRRRAEKNMIDGAISF